MKGEAAEIREARPEYGAKEEHVPPGYKRTEVGVIPEGWEVLRLGGLDPYVTSGSRGWAEFYSEVGQPFLRISNVRRRTIYLDLADVRYVDTRAVDSAEAHRTQLRLGDILISITADIGIIGFVDDRIELPAYLNQHLALVRVQPGRADTRFLAYWLASNRMQRLFISSQDVGAKSGMNLTTVRALTMALPPLPEQRAIARALSDVDDLISALDRLIEKKRAIKQATMQQLLTGRTRLPGFGGEWE
ncbi:MAG: restriction endonuclease subunit S, partial [Spirochaetes bacterium]|nr:restriction endonuclease subunit S [Spirochaetota bacterium]